ncbi:MAG: tetratricopeptide repeat protein [Bacteroidetes bacterium]|nr:tetratricopeptide repeat protein [Bacteroidota bacterium]
MRINNNIFYSEGSKKLKLLSVFILMFSSLVSVIAQEKENRDIIESKKLLSDAGLEMKNGNFPLAEADYRKAISLNPKDEIGKYNLGTAYYNKEMNANAMQRFLQAASVASNKTEKHKAFHNLGNTFMNDKKYKEAVETYKNALRNNPTDDETRYNLALAKKMLEEEQKKGGDDEDNKDKDNKENQNNKDNKDNKDNKEGDDGDEKEDKDKGDEKDDKKEGDEKEDKGNPEQPKEEKKDRKQPVPGKLSTQQIKNLLEAMNNEEKKVQDKINAEKQKGIKIKNSKDW